MTAESKQSPLDRIYWQAQAFLDTTPPDEKKATALFLKAAKAGHAASQCEYGYSCAQGRGIAQNYHEAANWYEKAADKGIRVAQNNFAHCLKTGQGRDRDDSKAAKYFKMAAEAGHLDAMIMIGQCYQEGDGVRQNSHTALTWFTKAVGKHPNAWVKIGDMYLLGAPQLEKNLDRARNCYLKGAQTDNPSYAEYAFKLGLLYHQDKDPKSAVGWYEKAHQKGDIRATYSLGMLYSTGEGVVPKDAAKAVKLFEIAAKHGFLDAASKLGHMLFYGNGISKNEVEGIRYLQQAAIGNEANALHTLGVLTYNGVSEISQNKKEAITYFERAFAQQDAQAALQLGKLYTVGVEGVLVPDLVKAFNYFQKAAEWGNVEGAYEYARCYVHGTGVTPNDKEAFYWLKKATGMGSGKAAAVLGFYYKRGGIGLSIDLGLSIKYSRIAADKGENEGALQLGVAYETGEGLEINLKKAVYWYQKAATAEPPSAVALLNLGVLYAAGGEGLNKDEKTALDCFTKAAELGHPMAALALAERFKEGNGVEKNITTAFDWYKKAANQGNGSACFIMGLFHAIGSNVAQNLKVAERYLRTAAANGHPEALFYLALLIKERNEELADRLMMGNAVSSTDPIAETKGGKAAPKFEQMLYDLLKRLGDVNVFIKAREEGENSIKLDKIYRALEEEFERFSSAQDKKGSDPISEFEARIAKIESELSSVEQIKAKWEIAEAATKSQRKSLVKTAPSLEEVKGEVKEVKNDFMTDEEKDEEGEDEALDADTETTAEKSSSEEALPPVVVMLHRELLRLETALKESLALDNETATPENLTNRREGLLAIMGRIHRHIAEKIEDKSVGKYTALHDKNAQRASNYLWHHDGLSTPITSDNLAEQVARVAAIHHAAAAMQAHFVQKIQMIEEAKDVKDASLATIDSPFLKESLTTRCKDFNPDAQIAHYKAVSANAGFRKRGSNVLANEKWLRLVAMTESAYAQIRNTHPKRYHTEQLWREHNAVKKIGKWIRHPGIKKTTAEDLTRIVQKKQKDYKREHQFSTLPGNMLRPEANVGRFVAPVETKTESKGDAKRAPISIAASSLALRGSPAHSGSSGSSAGAAAASSAGSAAAPSSAPKGLA